jgi:outer membrane PBP1 activator LpoA protein
LRTRCIGVKLRGIVLRGLHQLQGTLLCALLALVLAGCEMTGFGTGGPTQTPRAPAESAETAQHREAAQALEQQARKSDAAARDGFLWQAAEEWFAAGETRRGLRDLEAASALPGPNASPVQQLLAARVELERNLPQRTLDRVLKLSRPLPPELMSEALDLEGRARFALGDGGGAVAALVAREHWLRDSAAVQANERVIWDGLQKPGLSLTPPKDADSTVVGWLELARTVAGRDVRTIKPALLAWRERFPKHPANGTLLPTWLAEARPAARVPQRVALVLPLSGRLEPAAAAVRDGFLTATFAEPDEHARPEVLVFDTDQLGPEGAYDSAVRAGVDFVVGPLSKNEVGRVAAVEHGTPVLALNQLAEGAAPPGDFYQFALAPEDEAAQIAARALADGHHNALALVSADDLGRRMLESFTVALERGGGRVVANEAFDPGATDHQSEIKRLLALDASQSRYRALAAVLGEKLEFQASPRQDADFLFLGAQAGQARLLRPELRFHLSTELAVYATSSVYEPDPRANEDLDGIVFADMPWIVAPTADDPLLLALRELAAGEWQRRARFYALGYDAYGLVSQLYAGGGRARLAGATGLLTVDPDGRVHRELSFAQLRNGVPQALAMPSTTDVTPQALDTSARP